MSGFEYTQSIAETMQQANEALCNLQPAAIDKAEAEADYRSKLAAKELALRDQGFPATLIKDLARGDEEVCKRQIRRDVTEALYDATKEELMLRKVELKLLNDTMNREYGGQR